MDIASLFRPLDEDVIQKRVTLDNFRLSDYTKFNFGEFPNWRKADIVVIGCPEDKGSRELGGSAMAPDQIRRHFYHLTIPKKEIAIADLGNMVKADRMTIYYDRLQDIVQEIVQAGKLLIILGGSQDIVYGQYRGYEKVTTHAEYVCIDSELDVEDSDFGIHNHSFNHKIFLHSPNFLANFTHIGHQTYLVPMSDRKRMENLHFHSLRLGEIRQDLKEAEPFLRNANLVSFDLSAVRASDAPGTTHPSPAGFTTEEICQLARYTGLANRISSVSFCEVQPMKDLNGQTAMLTGIMMWYLIEGYYSRRIDEPDDLSRLTKYSVNLHGGMQEIVFYKNPMTERWWMEVPYADSLNRKANRRELIPCSETDYQTARGDEIPEKWWLAHYKLK